MRDAAPKCPCYNNIIQMSNSTLSHGGPKRIHDPSDAPLYGGGLSQRKGHQTWRSVSSLQLVPLSIVVRGIHRHGIGRPHHVHRENYASMRKLILLFTRESQQRTPPTSIRVDSQFPWPWSKSDDGPRVARWQSRCLDRVAYPSQFVDTLSRYMWLQRFEESLPRLRDYYRIYGVSCRLRNTITRRGELHGTPYPSIRIQQCHRVFCYCYSERDSLPDGEHKTL